MPPLSSGAKTKVRSVPVEAMLDRANDLLSVFDHRGKHRIGGLLRDWQSCSGRSIGTTADVAGEFADNMRVDGDLAPAQVDQLLGRVCPSDRLPLGVWLAECNERLLLRIRLWFPLWTAYTSWALDWCWSRGYPQLVFLARDSLPLYAAARALHPELTLALVDVPRTLLNSPGLVDYLTASIDWTKRTAIVDTGCYGTVVTRVAEYGNEIRSSEDVAALFFTSRNPRIFGYVNYLMAPHYLHDCHEPPGRRGPMDFAIYACDVIEALPKPYHVDVKGQADLGDHLARTPSDAASFVLSLLLYAELARSAARAASDAQRAALAADQLYQRFRDLGRDPHLDAVMLLTSAAPKGAPDASSPVLRSLISYAPQCEIFGTRAGDPT